MAVILCGLFILLASGLLVLTKHIWVNFARESEQVQHWDTAASLARDIQPFLTSEISYTGLQDTFYRYFRLFPGADFYLLNETGEIVYFFNNNQPLRTTRITLDPIRKFTDPERSHSIPLLGDNPLLETQAPTIFSAAPLFGLDQKTWFVYVVLRNWRSSSQVDILGTSYVLRSGIAGFSAILITVLCVGLILFFVLTRRIASLLNVVRRFERGELSERIEETSVDEIGQLGRAFNSMATSVQVYIAKLSESDTLRRELVANISHDLRTPLTAAIGNLELCLSDLSTADLKRTETFVERSLSTLTYLSELIGDLFELAKLEARERIPHLQAVDLRSIFELISIKYRPLCSETETSIRCQIDPACSSVLADAHMFERALSNLAENAIRYNRPGGSVLLSARPAGRNVRIEIKDTGIGIPPDELAFVFDRLYRARTSKAEVAGGSGLGLAIVKRIIEALGTNIHVESEVNQGTNFWFELQTPSPAP